MSASEEAGREAKIREKIQPRYRWPAVSSLKGTPQRGLENSAPPIKKIQGIV